jgi:hypothetical protein
MILMSASGMPAAAIKAAGIVAAAEGLSVRRILWCRKKHLPKRKGHNTGEHQQKHAKMHPTGRVHLGPLPRLGRQIHSTERM